MNENKHTSSVIYVYDSNVQILPNATEAVLNIYGSCPDGALPKVIVGTGEGISPEASRLSVYISKENLGDYLVRIGSCTTASELAQVIVSMLGREPGVTPELVVKQKFISLFLPLAPKLVSGRSIDNIRCRINDLLARRPHRMR